MLLSEDQLRVATSLVNNRDMTKALNLRNSTNNIIAQFTTDRDIDNDWKKQINHLLIQLPGNRKTLNFKNIGPDANTDSPCSKRSKAG